MSYIGFPAPQKRSTRGIASVKALGRKPKGPVVLLAWGTGCRHNNAASNVPDLSLSAVTVRATMLPVPLTSRWVSLPSL